jgi:putative transposase
MAIVKGFTRSIQRELLNPYVFRSLSEVKQMVKKYSIDYKYHRPHDSLDDKTPGQMMDEIKEKVSDFEWT